tara:strand:- start:555 stop:698 length:144 start_codon:yes stop_codon:yes gene_type:complete
MVEVAHSPFIIDAAGTFSCYQCYQTGNRDKIRHEPLEVIKDISKKLK